MIDKAPLEQPSGLLLMADQMEVVGDPKHLPDEFFKALAGLLLASVEADHPEDQ